MNEYAGEDTLLSLSKLVRKEFAAIRDAINKLPTGSNGVPKGSIVIWSGTTANIPSGWALCDGKNGRPDLRDRFVLGSGGTTSTGAKGGSKEVTLTVEQMPAHQHGLKLQQYSEAYTSIYPMASNEYKGTQLIASGINPIQSAGGGLPHPNMPPYYVLCYIIKIAES